MKDKNELIFKCSRCGGDTIEIIDLDAEVTTKIKKIVGHNIEYCTPAIESSEETYYICGDCGLTIKDEYGVAIDNEEDLTDWLKEEMTKRTVLEMVTEKDKKND